MNSPYLHTSIGGLRVLPKAYNIIGKMISLGQLSDWHNKIIQEILTFITPQQSNTTNILEINPKGCSLLLKLNEKNSQLNLFGQEENPALYLSSKELIETLKVKTNDKIQMKPGSPLQIESPNHSMDAIILTFGLRFIQPRQAFYREVQRVLKPNGKLLLLEIGRPKEYILDVLSKHKKSFFLNKLSLLKQNSRQLKFFPSGKELVAELYENKFSQIHFESCSFGMTSFYEARFVN